MPRLPSAAVGALLVCAPGLAAQSASAPPAPTLTLGGEVNVQYTASSVDAYPSGFTLRRVRLNGTFVVNELMDAHVQAELAATGGAELRDAWVRFTFSPALKLSAGQFKRAFDLFELDSFTDLSLIERDGRVGGVSTCTGVGSVCSYSRFTEGLGYAGRDQGVRLEGTAERVSYMATATNGTGQNAPEDDQAKSLSGRVSVEVARRVAVGAQLALHERSDTLDGTHHASAWSADISYGAFRSGLLLQAALAGGDNWGADRGDRGADLPRDAGDGGMVRARRGAPPGGGGAPAAPELGRPRHGRDGRRGAPGDARLHALRRREEQDRLQPRRMVAPDG